jgi:N-carbamoyl-L-amino-acid hydrolase
MTPVADAGRVWQELQQLATFSDAAAPAVTRVVFTETDQRARRFFRTSCEAAGLAVREDAIGNTFARWAGTAGDLPAVGTGSHLDAIPNAGRFDGTVGVFGGLEAVRALQAAGVRPRRPIDVIMFTSEEPTRFGLGCLGSRMMSGSLDAPASQRLRDTGNRTLDEVRQAAGFSGALDQVRIGSDAYAAFVELHIEQGPLLERAASDIGVVTAIAAPASFRLVIDGQGGHAGAVLMPDRHDAFMAAAEMALTLESAVRTTGSIDTVGTVGVCELFPGAINSIPSRVRLDIDVRDIDEARRNAVLSHVERAGGLVAERRGVAVRRDVINIDPPAICAADIVDAVSAACAGRGVKSQRMISRAYHDSLFMARVAPTGMIFIPCRDGISHRPDEYASPEAIAKGVEVLADTLAALAS